MNFTAIDFETATASRGSACSIGLVRVENGTVAAKLHRLIRPPGNRYDRMNISIHGITPDMTKNEPSFCELWPELAPYLSGQSVIAHNASFDMSVLRYCLDADGREYPPFAYYCTYLFARSLWPGRSSYVLSDLARQHGIRFAHHRADEDAYACARLALAMLEQEGAASLEELAARCGYRPGAHQPGGYTPFGKLKPPKPEPRGRGKAAAVQNETAAAREEERG
ncbi:3'-5' exonuclease [Gorillibacterium sp. sgz500922]|uniref:3'-5' exonuclease n=1 Tax=Gorillibacterium sp. sgz500922 TaxID=3446694 RepID=UPI003F665639